MRSIRVAAAALSLLLAACTSTGALQPAQPDATISGTVTRGLLEPYRVEVTLDGKVYRGEWRTDAPTAQQRAETPYPHRHHVGKVQSTLRADDGATLACNWLTDGYRGEGACASGDRQYPLILK